MSKEKVLKSEVARLEAERDALEETLSEERDKYGELDCSIASAFEWKLDGELYEDAVRRIVAENKLLKAEAERLQRELSAFDSLRPVIRDIAEAWAAEARAKEGER